MNTMRRVATTCSRAPTGRRPHSETLITEYALSDYYHICCGIGFFVVGITGHITCTGIWTRPTGHPADGGDNVPVSCHRVHESEIIIVLGCGTSNTDICDVHKLVLCLP